MNILIGWNSKFLDNNGGMEKVMCNFSNEMQKRGHQVTLVYCTEKAGTICNPIRKEIKLLNIADFLPGKKWESAKPISFILKREILRCINKHKMKQAVMQFDIKYLGLAMKKIFNMTKPDVIIAIDASTAALFIAEKDIDVPLVTMNHFNAEHILADLSEIEGQALLHSNIVQVLMPHDKDVLEKVLPSIRITCIPNVVPQYAGIKSDIIKTDTIIDVARIDAKQKRQHLLIEAFARIAHIYPSWNIEFWGDEQGGKKYTKQLEDLINKYHLENRVFFKGNTKDVLSVYKKARIFAFPSAYEGFPLALTEAMSAGLPTIAYRSCPAVNELIKDEKTGLLVEDGIDSFALGLEKLIKNESTREALGKAAQENMKQYSPANVYDMWENLLFQVTVH